MKKKTTIYLDENVFKLLKHVAIEEELSMSEYVENLIIEDNNKEVR
jgi:hypothetical protein